MSFGPTRDTKWISLNQMRREQKAPPRTKYEPPVDVEASKVVGREVKVNDPRLIQVVHDWKRNHNPEPQTVEDADYFKHSEFRENLKKAIPHV